MEFFATIPVMFSGIIRLLFTSMISLFLPFLPATASTQEAALRVDYFELRAGEGDVSFFGEAYGEVPAGPVVASAKLGAEAPLGDAFETIELELRASRRISAGIEAFVGGKHEFVGGGEDFFATAGLAAPLGPFFGTELSLDLSEAGNAFAKLELAGELALDAVFIEPKAELYWSAQSDEEAGVGDGLSELVLELRAGTELAGGVMPYVGVAHSRLLGSTKAIARGAGEGFDATVALAGLRYQF